MKQFHTFGLHCFILNSKLFENKLIQKWKPKPKQGVYLGILPHHAGSIALVLNVKTGYISPQFHIVFDENFTTTLARIKKKLPAIWDDLLDNNCELPP